MPASYTVQALTADRYHTLWVPICEQPLHMRRRHRLNLLLRTLQGRPDLASRVRRISVAAGICDEQSDQARQALTIGLGNIVRQCRGVRVLCGWYPQISNGRVLDNFNETLVAGGELREYVWLLDGIGQAQQRLPLFSGNPNHWERLETLVIRETVPVLTQGSMYSILHQLPALQHLGLVGLSPQVFHDGTLQALTGLKSLRLEALDGLSDRGLGQTLPRLASSLRNLSLVDLDIKSLRTLSLILTSYHKLRRFTLVQDSPPGLPLGADVTLAVDLPILGSPSLIYIHWEILVPGSANQALETSIKSGGFPSLQILRAPCDSDGALQSLCRPVTRRSLSVKEAEEYRHQDTSGYTRDLALARTAAQLRTRYSQHTPAVSVVIEDGGSVQHTQIVGQYLGNISSNIAYDLESDFEGTRHALGRVEDLLKCETLTCYNARKRKSHVVVRKRKLEGLF